MKKQVNYHITSQEIIELHKHVTFNEVMAANTLVIVFHKAGYGSKQDFVFGYSACFRAGIVEGKRQERAKKKSTKLP